MSSFNEPWSFNDVRDVIGRDGKSIEEFISGDSAKEAAFDNRAVACVNALAGLNPGAVKDVVEAAQIIIDSYANESITGSVDASHIRAEWLPKLAAALAKLRNETPTAAKPQEQ